MKLNYVSMAALMCLVACGGSDPGPARPSAALIGGEITGLSGAATVLLVNNGTNTIAVKGNGPFAFDLPVPVGGTYNVTLFRQPTGSFCRISNGAGTIGQNDRTVNKIAVSCEVALVGFFYYNIGVTVTGLKTGAALTVLNYDEDPLVISTNGLSVFPQSYAMQAVKVGREFGRYVVKVSAQPIGQTCTLQNETGTMQLTSFSDFVNVTATCK